MQSPSPRPCPLSLSLPLADHLNSISGDAKRRPDVLRMANWLNDQLVSLGVSTKLVDLGKSKLDWRLLQG